MSEAPLTGVGGRRIKDEQEDQVRTCSMGLRHLRPPNSKGRSIERGDIKASVHTQISRPSPCDGFLISQSVKRDGRRSAELFRGDAAC